jgi:hypothetical protein
MEVEVTRNRLPYAAALVVVLGLVLMPLTVALVHAAEPAGEDDGGDEAMGWGELGLAALFGALGGVVYELIALQATSSGPTGRVRRSCRRGVSAMPRSGLCSTSASSPASSSAPPQRSSSSGSCLPSTW